MHECQKLGRFLSSIFLGDWQLFLLSSSFSCWWGLRV